MTRRPGITKISPLAYMKSLLMMKSYVSAMYLLTNALGYAIGEAFTPLMGDPEIFGYLLGCV
jgi:POT family proton-dependent oligopeptide transporter